MKVLVLGPVWPEPTSSAAGIHLLAILKALVKQNWQVFFGSSAQPSDYSHNLNVLGITPVSVAMNDESFDQMVNELSPSIVIFDRFMTEEQFSWRVKSQCPNAMCILNMEDLHCLRHQREKSKHDYPNLPQLLQYDELFSREIAAIYRSDLSLVISEHEMKLLTEQVGIPSSLLSYCPFWLSHPQQAILDYSQRKDFVFIGNFLHKPNWDAVLFLTQQIWPAIHKQIPQAKLNIYGAYASNKHYALNNPKMGILMHGRADNVEAVMTTARVCLAPLRFGAGLKGKLVDAMMYGTPNVTTWIGAEGLTSEHPWPGFIANHPRHFVEAAINLYTNENTWRTAQSRGFQLLKDKFDSTYHESQFLGDVERVKNHLTAHRKLSAIPLILNHHLHKSTTYMSKWIECKEKLKLSHAKENETSPSEIR